ncbi:MAG: hypothetical protein PHR56_07775 [Dehalococcoidales bacterium]|nr:hypothetical protein [Dehalococcoidales bacterium]
MAITRAFITKDDLHRFLQNHGNSRIKRELLAFLGRHHSTRFAIFAICHSLGYHRVDVEEALTCMIVAGIVEKHHSLSTASYSLTTEDEKRRIVMALAALDWEQWQLLVKEITVNNNGAPGPDAIKNECLVKG